MQLMIHARSQFYDRILGDTAAATFDSTESQLNYPSWIGKALVNQNLPPMGEESWYRGEFSRSSASLLAGDCKIIEILQIKLINSDDYQGNCSRQQ